MDIQAALRSFEAVFRCGVSFHDLGPLRSCLALNNRAFHVNSFCAQVKSSGRKFDRQCAAFDAETARERLHSGHVAFYKICHAGVLELVVSIIHHDRLAQV